MIWIKRAAFAALACAALGACASGDEIAEGLYMASDAVAMERAHQEQCYPRELTFPSSAPGQQLCPGDYGWDAAIATPHANERRRRHRH
ncbi:MAG TPA: hypothetical protein PLN53_00475 [Terricaulis sp.]|nr:hypothetical protein [Terricaulis sp.]